VIHLIFEKLRQFSQGVIAPKQVDTATATATAKQADTATATATEQVIASRFDVAIKNKMTISEAGVALICGFEGLRLSAYNDGVGVWSIGYGTTRYPDGRVVKRGDFCTLAQAKAYMAHDLEKFAFVVKNVVMVPLTQNQFDALVSLTYNIGIGAFKESTLLRVLNGGDCQAAAAQFDVWNRAGGKVLQGLVNRRQVERKLFSRGFKK
jgi:lysozyme